jgi:menaquinone-dependent protoporphyrinogen IX oxidase
MKALVLYGSRWGGTVPVAEKIGETLRHEGYIVDIFESRNSPKDVSGYDLFIIGSGIRADKWKEQAIAFIEKNAELLRTKKTALFVSCMVDREKEDAKDKAKTLYLDKVAEQFGLHPISLGFFGGYLDFRKSHGLLVDIIVRVNGWRLKKRGLDTSVVYDTRDFEHVKAWAHELAQALCLGEQKPKDFSLK